MSNHFDFEMNTDFPVVYQLKLQGHLGAEWAEWFGGLTIAPEEDGITLITGPVRDQAALFGLLKKVRDLGLTLISVNPIKTSERE
ncbi:MAG TPA: hypothetical protein PKH77_15910 [Anaerolineae bacterium]|nr:hypothetical protein [Anaerolineae bacterium]